MLKRISSQQIKFDWYNQFCGEAGDSDTLQSHLSRPRHQLNGLSFVPHLLDEEAPVRLMSQKSRSVLFYNYYLLHSFDVGMVWTSVEQSGEILL